MEERLLTTEEVAKIHGVTRGAVVKWIASGHMDAEKVGRDYLVRESDAITYKRRPKTGRPPK
jgi:excisionase family DNA binding protein